jgi:hypothetical protein
MKTMTAPTSSRATGPTHGVSDSPKACSMRSGTHRVDGSSIRTTWPPRTRNGYDLSIPGWSATTRPDASQPSASNALQQTLADELVAGDPRFGLLG